MVDLRYSSNPEKIKLLEKVFYRLVSFLPKAYKDIQLGLVFTELEGRYKTYQGGYAVHSTLNIGTEFLNKYGDNELALAEIVAHELGHHVLGHTNLTGEGQIHPGQEQDADHFGMMLCELAGYTRENFIAWFNKFEEDRKSSLSEKHIQEHGTGNQRIEKLIKQDKYLTELENF